MFIAIKTAYVRILIAILASISALHIVEVQAMSVYNSREIREPPEWKGVLEKPDSPYCPPNFTNPLKEPFIFKCKAAIIGEVKNFSGFTPGIWEDKQDADWAFLKQYWQTGRKFYFSSSQCSGGQTKDSDTGAKMAARQWTQQRVKRWEAELSRSKFRPYLGFQELKTEYSCVPGIISAPSPAAQEREDDEGESKAVASSDTTTRGQNQNSVRFDITSRDTKRIRVTFYAKARNNAWPSWTTSYPINGFDSSMHSYPLTCKAGEQICYGAWREDDESVSWGVGRDAKLGCENCCTTCGSGTKSVALNAGRDGPPPNSLSIRMRSLDNYRVQFELYSQSYNRAWPGNGRAYTLANSEFNRYEISCQKGEKISYGAWREGNSSRYWGVGANDKYGCTNCCMTCGSGEHTYTLQPADESPTASSGGGSGIVEALSAGVAIGSAIGTIVGGGVGGTTARRPTIPNYSGDHQRRQSDISGTR